MAKITDTFGNTAEFAKGIVVYEIGYFGEYAGEKRGQQFSRKHVLTHAFDMGHGSHWVNGDDGNTQRLVFDGAKSNHVARWSESEDRWKIDSLLSLKPVGELL